MAERYTIDRPLACRLLNIGLNDSYLIETGDARYVLRVYRLGWRTPSAIRYELDLLRHLERTGIAVSTPVATRDGDPLWEVRAPEGTRHVVLFTYAPGQPCYADSGEEEEVRRYGAAVANVHAGMADFASPHQRFPIDLPHLLDSPLAVVGPLLAHRPDDLLSLHDLAARLKEQVAGFIAQGLTTSVCHGDFHGGNANMQDNQVTFYDFDCCGPGWLAYDLAVTRWGQAGHGKDEALWPAFLQGYTARRAIPDIDLAAVPAFVLIREIWLLGLHAAGAGDWGCAWLNDRYFDRALRFLREWEAKHMGTPA